MSYRIAGIDVHKKILAVVVSDVEVENEYQFERRMFGSAPTNCDRWPLGCSSKRSRKPLWNRRHSIGNQFGKHWNNTGNRYPRSGKAQAGGRELCIWRRRNPIAGGGDARGTSQMPNAW
jgi:hypothetical protein